MKILLSHIKGNQNSLNAVLALKKAKMLHTFITSINVDYKKFPLNILPKKIKIFLESRNFNNITKKIITTSLPLEFLRLGLCKIFKIDYVNGLYKKIDLLTSKILYKYKGQINAIYAYENGALKTFKVAKKNNIKCIYELPSCYWRAKNKSFSDDNSININKDKELKLADLIIVPSTFSKKTLKKLPFKNKKIIVVPYGFPKVTESKKKWFNNKKKLKLLYVGGLEEMKGLNHFIAAIKKLNIIHKNMLVSTIIGTGPLEKYIKKELPNENFKKNLSHNLILKEMKKHDILIFPSLFEGFGLVISEAMSQGMVVISTNKTGLPDISNKNDDSITIPPNNSKDIIKKINYFVSHPKEVKRFGRNAQKTASKYKWSDYQKKLINTINQELKIK